MRVLITGGAGFIGSHIADQLAARGDEPVLLDSLTPTAHGVAPEQHRAAERGRAPEHNRAPEHDRTTEDERTPGQGRVPGYVGEYEFHRADVTELRPEQLDGIDAVCHQAAIVGHGVDPADAPAYAWNNDYGTAVLLAAMHRAGVRKLVLASSMVVYGEGRYACAEHGIVAPAPRLQSDVDEGRFEPRCPHCGEQLESRLVPEDAPLNPRSTYAATKLAQEHLAGAWARQTGGRVWALRYHNVYGPRMPQNTPYAGVASLFRSALERGEAPTVLEDGRQRRDFVHVDDIARANLRALDVEPPEEITAVNVCSGEPHTVGDMAAELARACGGPEPRIVGGARPADVRHVVADPALAEKLLGFTASVGFREGVAGFATAPLRR
ncbi:NAD-dependent epimerase/dehydratase family protein [Amycolatopsis sp. 195334CR]|uniref:NAD-dependent epimerase/dehydratase family protein n=1 Tax=Amycolatopsis sp. 195334CR TaxID=2814588 RepID=UPI0027DD35BB|nr:NAD-dependent epimerase/dehydratase family protein [Amycolatopsis sp. 195334CR]